MKPIRKIALISFCLLCLLLVLQGQPADPNAAQRPATTAAAESTPERVILGWTGDPATMRTVTWRTAKRVDQPQVQFTVGSANPDFGKSATTVAAQFGALEIAEGRSVATYRANLEGLKPSMHYLYRVGDGKNWSEWYAFRTASERPDAFRFIYLGDAQNDIKSRWSRVVRAAYANTPDAAFIVSAGDLVNAGYRDDLWGEWYDAMGFIAATIPSVPVVGNHELSKPSGTPRSLALPAIWKPQFAYPHNGPGVPENESYYFDYQGVRFISLNVNPLANEKDFDANRPAIDQMVTWLEQVLKENPGRWIVVSQHQPIYSMAHGRNLPKMRELLEPLYEKYHVDLILQGHDHVYSRSRKIAREKVVANDAPGVVYMISVSGPKMYKLDKTFEPLMAKVIADTQMFQIVDVSPDKLVLRAYSSEGELLDGFQLEKKNGGSVYSELPRFATAGSAR